MSGIAGLVRWDGAPATSGSIAAMLATLRRRGPDRRDAWVSGPAALGQALLGTTPEAAAEPQPWISAANGCVVVSDSRLDNREELLGLLGMRPEHADNVGDGTLLHAAWQRWGARCVERLRGDFAFALWDPAQRSLFLARDPFGVRPLYYHHAPGRLLAFGSQADTVLALAEVPADIDRARLADAMLGELEGVDSTTTFFPAIRRLAPAHAMLVTARGIAASRYWWPAALDPSAPARTASEWAEALQDGLRRAVVRRLRGSARVGSMMSGGLDSTSVVAFACAASPGRPFPVFSAIDSRGDCAETAGIRRMQAAFGLEAHEADLADLSSLLPALCEDSVLSGEPFDGTMTLLSAQYLMASRAGVRILLDGMPADLLYGIGERAQALARSGQPLRALAVLRNRFRADGMPHPLPSALRSVAWSFAPSAWRDARMQRVWQAQYRSLLARSLLDPREAGMLDMASRHRTFRLASHRAQADPRFSVMDAPYVHAAVDRYGRVAASHGIEPRHPFLDLELVELHRRLPVELVNRGGWSKWPLREAMSALLPPDIAWGKPRQHLGAGFNQARADALGMAPAMAAAFDPRVARSETIRALGRWQDEGDADAFDAIQDAWLTMGWLAAQTAPRGTIADAPIAGSD